MSENVTSWRPSSQTKTPKSGYKFAVNLSRMAVKLTQPSDEIRQKLRPVSDQDTGALIAISHVVAVHFETVAQVNNYWR